jgi:hypothetical protein
MLCRTMRRTMSDLLSDKNHLKYLRVRSTFHIKFSVFSIKQDEIHFKIGSCLIPLVLKMLDPEMETFELTSY